MRSVTSEPETKRRVDLIVFGVRNFWFGINVNICSYLSWYAKGVEQRFSLIHRRLVLCHAKYQDFQ